MNSKKFSGSFQDCGSLMPLSTKVLGVICPDELAQANTSIVNDTFVSQSFTASSNLTERKDSHL